MKEQSTSTQANIACLPIAHTAMRHVGAGRHFRTSHMIPLWRVRSFEAFSLFFSFLFIFILGKSSNYTCYPDPSKKKKRPNFCGMQQQSFLPRKRFHIRVARTRRQRLLFFFPFSFFPFLSFSYIRRRRRRAIGLARFVAPFVLQPFGIRWA